jgi:hypothetical protein
MSTCACCGQPGEIVARGWISACYFRWYRAGRPDTGPPPRQRMRQKDRLAEYTFLREGGEDPRTAAHRVGLHSPYRIREYERKHKAVA